MVEVIRSSLFERNVKHIKDAKLKERIKKQIQRIVESPETTGDYLKYSDECEKKIYIPPYRMLFRYDKMNKIIYLIDFDRRDRIYEKRGRI